MGVDSRIKDLTGEVLDTELSALLDTLYLAVDDKWFTDAEKVKWTNLITSAAVDEDSTNDYQALTPKGFYDSRAEVGKRGVVAFANADEIRNMENAKVISSFDLRQVHRNERARLFKEGVPDYYAKSAAGTATSSPCCWAGSLDAYDRIKLAPSPPVGYVVNAYTISISVTSSLGSGAGTYSGTNFGIEYPIGSSGMKILILPYGIYIGSSTPASAVATLRFAAYVTVTHTVS